jgi:hypothetical protein
MLIAYCGMGRLLISTVSLHLLLFHLQLQQNGIIQKKLLEFHDSNTS